MAPVLEIQDLSTHIKLTSSVVQAVGNVDLQRRRRERPSASSASPAAASP